MEIQPPQKSYLLKQYCNSIQEMFEYFTNLPYEWLNGLQRQARITNIIEEIESIAFVIANMNDQHCKTPKQQNKIQTASTIPTSSTISTSQKISQLPQPQINHQPSRKLLYDSYPQICNSFLFRQWSQQSKYQLLQILSLILKKIVIIHEQQLQRFIKVAIVIFTGSSDDVINSNVLKNCENVLSFIAHIKNKFFPYKQQQSNKTKDKRLSLKEKRSIIMQLFQQFYCKSTPRNLLQIVNFSIIVYLDNVNYNQMPQVVTINDLRILFQMIIKCQFAIASTQIITISLQLLFLFLEVQTYIVSNSKLLDNFLYLATVMKVFSRKPYKLLSQRQRKFRKKILHSGHFFINYHTELIEDSEINVLHESIFSSIMDMMIQKGQDYLQCMAALMSLLKWKFTIGITRIMIKKLEIKIKYEKEKNSNIQQVIASGITSCINSGGSNILNIPQSRDRKRKYSQKILPAEQNGTNSFANRHWEEILQLMSKAIRLYPTTYEYIQFLNPQSFVLRKFNEKNDSEFKNTVILPCLFHLNFKTMVAPVVGCLLKKSVIEEVQNQENSFLEINNNIYEYREQSLIATLICRKGLQYWILLTETNKPQNVLISIVQFKNNSPIYQVKQQFNNWNRTWKNDILLQISSQGKIALILNSQQKLQQKKISLTMKSKDVIAIALGGGVKKTNIDQLYKFDYYPYITKKQFYDGEYTKFDLLKYQHLPELINGKMMEAQSNYENQMENLYILRKKQKSFIACVELLGDLDLFFIVMSHIIKQTATISLLCLNSFPSFKAKIMIKQNSNNLISMINKNMAFFGDFVKVKGVSMKMLTSQENKKRILKTTCLCWIVSYHQQTYLSNPVQIIKELIKFLLVRGLSETNCKLNRMSITNLCQVWCNFAFWKNFNLDDQILIFEEISQLFTKKTQIIEYIIEQLCKKENNNSNSSKKLKIGVFNTDFKKKQKESDKKNDDEEFIDFKQFQSQLQGFYTYTQRFLIEILLFYRQKSYIKEREKNKEDNQDQVLNVDKYNEEKDKQCQIFNENIERERYLMVLQAFLVNVLSNSYKQLISKCITQRSSELILKQIINTILRFVEVSLKTLTLLYNEKKQYYDIKLSIYVSSLVKDIMKSTYQAYTQLRKKKKDYDQNISCFQQILLDQNTISFLSKTTNKSQRYSRQQQYKKLNSIESHKDIIASITEYLQKVISYYKPTILHESFYSLYSIEQPQGFYTLEEKQIERNMSFLKIYCQSLSLESYANLISQIQKNRKLSESQCEAIWYIHGLKKTKAQKQIQLFYMLNYYLNQFENQDLAYQVFKYYITEIKQCYKPPNSIIKHYRKGSICSQSHQKYGKLLKKILNQLATSTNFKQQQYQISKRSYTEFKRLVDIVTQKQIISPVFYQRKSSYKGTRKNTDQCEIQKLLMNMEEQDIIKTNEQVNLQTINEIPASLLEKIHLLLMYNEQIVYQDFFDKRNLLIFAKNNYKNLAILEGLMALRSILQWMKQFLANQKIGSRSISSMTFINKIDVGISYEDINWILHMIEKLQNIAKQQHLSKQFLAEFSNCSLQVAQLVRQNIIINIQSLKNGLSKIKNMHEQIVGCEKQLELQQKIKTVELMKKSVYLQHHYLQKQLLPIILKANQYILKCVIYPLNVDRYESYEKPMNLYRTSNQHNQQQDKCQKQAMNFIRKFIEQRRKALIIIQNIWDQVQKNNQYFWQIFCKNQSNYRIDSLVNNLKMPGFLKIQQKRPEVPLPKMPVQQNEKQQPKIKGSIVDFDIQIEAQADGTQIQSQSSIFENSEKLYEQSQSSFDNTESVLQSQWGFCSSSPKVQQHVYKLGQNKSKPQPKNYKVFLITPIKFFYGLLTIKLQKPLRIIFQQKFCRDSEKYEIVCAHESQKRTKEQITRKSKNFEIIFDGRCEVIQKKYLFDDRALEIYSDVDCKTYFFYFLGELDRGYFLKKLLLSNKYKLPQQINQLQFLRSSKNIYHTNPINYLTNHELALKYRRLWQKGLITNFEYLMKLNDCAGRTFNSLSQYYVFPWTYMKFDENSFNPYQQSNYRDLSLPIGKVSQQRWQTLKKRYEQTLKYSQKLAVIPSRKSKKKIEEVQEKNKSKIFSFFSKNKKEKSQQKFIKRNPSESSSCSFLLTPFLFGSFYSNPAIVCYFLVRTQPFACYHYQLQGTKFDHADRLFYSIHQQAISNLSNQADLKELIPQFYCNWQFLINRSRYNLGIKQNKDKVNDVILPKWIESQKRNGAAEQFIFKMRQALQSSFTTQNLHSWIDLIFGWKGKKQYAAQCQNLFTSTVYELSSEQNQKIDPSQKQSFKNYYKQFGQNPCCLFERGETIQQKKIRIKKQKWQESSIECLLNVTQFPVLLMNQQFKKTKQRIKHKNTAISQKTLSEKINIFSARRNWKNCFCTNDSIETELILYQGQIFIMIGSNKSNNKFSKMLMIQLNNKKSPKQTQSRIKTFFKGLISTAKEPDQKSQLIFNGQAKYKFYSIDMLLQQTIKRQQYKQAKTQLSNHPINAFLLCYPKQQTIATSLCIFSVLDYSCKSQRIQSDSPIKTIDFLLYIKNNCAFYREIVNGHEFDMRKIGKQSIFINSFIVNIMKVCKQFITVVSENIIIFFTNIGYKAKSSKFQLCSTAKNYNFQEVFTFTQHQTPIVLLEVCQRLSFVISLDINNKIFILHLAKNQIAVKYSFHLRQLMLTEIPIKLLFHEMGLVIIWTSKERILVYNYLGDPVRSSTVKILPSASQTKFHTQQLTQVVNDLCIFNHEQPNIILATSKGNLYKLSIFSFNDKDITLIYAHGIKKYRKVIEKIKTVDDQQRILEYNYEAINVCQQAIVKISSQCIGVYWQIIAVTATGSIYTVHSDKFLKIKQAMYN